ncbi:hypothetical protein L873DRAFT_1796192 [Choiromyces venosus 120613-1]|uniref:Uncharacterized protein n=1 Tax=Choiromyces venosus 120613-1 TaxID=1336337 RepID=A0A3N4ITM4_9PEZI|nr:hypothetical protein L873DRAFT_1796192 [Choiromyces venosus 120613-1]
MDGTIGSTIEIYDFLKNTFVDLQEHPDRLTVPTNTFFPTQDPPCDVPVPIAFIWTINEPANLLVKQVIKGLLKKNPMLTGELGPGATAGDRSKEIWLPWSYHKIEILLASYMPFAFI